MRQDGLAVTALSIMLGSRLAFGEAAGPSPNPPILAAAEEALSASRVHDLFDGSQARLPGADAAVVEVPDLAGPAPTLAPASERPRSPAVPDIPAAGPVASAGPDLAQRAAMFEALTDRVIGPHGLVGNSSDSAIWTGVYTAAQAYRYASTRDPDALRKMERSLRGLHALHEITGVPGLIARKIECAPPNGEESHPGHGKYEGCRWKGKVSFDQYLGYLYGISEAWPHIQDPELKALLREDVRQIARHFMEKGGRIEGLDTYLDSSPYNYYQHRWPWYLRWLAPLTRLLPARGGNAMHGLHLMKVASYVTEDPEIARYYREELVAKREYHWYVKHKTQGRTEGLVRGNLWWINLLTKLLYGRDVRATADSLRSSVGQNLGHIALYNLARLEADEELREFYAAGLEGTHAPVSRHGNAYWNFLHDAHLAPEPGTTQESIESLRRYPGPGAATPGEPVEPPIAAYKGLQTNFFKSDHPWNWYSERPLPFEKRNLHSFVWQHNATELGDGSVDTETTGGTAYLAAYWLGRQLGYIPEEGGSAGGDPDSDGPP